MIQYHLEKLKIFCHKGEGLTEIFSGNDEMVRKLGDILGLHFLSQKSERGNVCFADSVEVRPQFRETFTSIDFLDYVCAILLSGSHAEPKQSNNTHFIYRTEYTSRFWEMVEIGGEIRRLHSRQLDP
jgi:hypothetical protein